MEPGRLRPSSGAFVRREGAVRVLQVTGTYPSAENPEKGSLVQAQVDSLRDAGVELEVCVLSGRGWWKYLAGVGEVRRALRGSRFDLVHAHYSYAGWSARLATRLPLVVSFMGGDVLGVINARGEWPWLSRFLNRLASNVLAAVSAFSIAKSTGLADDIPWARRKAIIPNGVDFSTFRPQEVDRAAMGLDPGKRYVLFGGRTSERRKRYDLASRVVEIARKRHPTLEIVAIEGRDHAEVARYLNAVDCLLLTSRYEGSPNIVKEAVACNTPVVATDVGDVRERLAGVRNCRVATDDPGDLARALVEVLDAGDRADNGRESIRGLESGAIARQIIDVYRSVLGVAAAHQRTEQGEP